MGQVNQNWDRLLEFLFENSPKKFSLREISKKIKIPSSSLQRYFNNLKKEGLVDNEGRLISNSYVRFKKTFLMIDKIYKSQLLNFLEEKFAPSSIILFGSARKGEYDKESDIDLFIESQKKLKDIPLEKFEKVIGHKIHLFVEEDINKLPNNLLNSVVNGIKLTGYFKIK